MIAGTSDIFWLGTAPSTFCRASGGGGGGPLFKRVRYSVREFLDLDIPVITAINRQVIGEIFALVLLSDIIVAGITPLFENMHIPPVTTPASTGANFIAARSQFDASTPLSSDRRHSDRREAAEQLDW